MHACPGRASGRLRGTGETAETTAEAATEVQDTPVEDATPDALTISLPLTGHTASSLRNLATMVYSQGSLISKTTGRTFSCTLAQVDTLKNCITISSLLTRITPDLIVLNFLTAM